MKYFSSLILWFLVILSTLVLHGCTTEIESNNNRAYKLYSELMCPVCEGQTIGGSQASIAVDMRNIIQEQIEQGLSDEQILDYFQSRYGTEILAKPPKDGFNMIVWAAPILLLTIICLSIGFNLKATMKKNTK